MRYYLLLCFAVFAGCAVISHKEKLQTLKQLGKSQKEIGDFIDEQERSFSLLKEDIINGKLKAETEKKEIVGTYGDPILENEVEDNPFVKKVLLYRHPTRYFSSPRIYLYFDRKDRLVSWEHKPAE